MQPDLSKELAQVVNFAGRVFTHIRFCGWHAKTTGLEDGVKRMTNWANMAHNLMALGHLVEQYVDGDTKRRSEIVHACSHLASGMESEAQREASWPESDNPIDYSKAIAALRAMGDKLQAVEVSS
jgi:hypothetical protein